MKHGEPRTASRHSWTGTTTARPSTSGYGVRAPTLYCCLLGDWRLLFIVSLLAVVVDSAKSYARRSSPVASSPVVVRPTTTTTIPGLFFLLDINRSTSSPQRNWQMRRVANQTSTHFWIRPKANYPGVGMIYDLAMYSSSRLDGGITL